MAPHYISNLITVKQPACYSLCSCTSIVLLHPKGKMLTTFGDRSFSAAAPKLWNALPTTLRDISSTGTFKSKLKTYLLKLAFD